MNFRPKCPTILRPVGRSKEVATEVAEQTGLSSRKIRRAFNLPPPKPQVKVIPIAARSEDDAVLTQANAIVSAWNRACPEKASQQSFVVWIASFCLADIQPGKGRNDNDVLP